MGRKRAEKGLGVFYHRDSEGHSQLAPPQYVEWARGAAAKLGVAFAATPEMIQRMIASGQSELGDLYLDYGVSGNQLDRPGLNALRARVLGDAGVSHLFLPRRDRLARPDNPLDAMAIEYELRSAGLEIILMDGKVLPALKRGVRIDIADFFTSLIDYDASGKFRRDLAEKLIHAKIRLARGGFSIGGEPMYGFRRWLCAEDGSRNRELQQHEVVKMPGHHVVWLPTAADELAVVARILDLIETTPASRIARLLNDERIPSPNAGRTRKRTGVAVANSGLWTQTTVRNIVTHPLLVAVMEYGKRSEGDQLRFTPQGPRPLTDADYGAGGKPKTVTNPDEQVIRSAGKFEPVISAEKHANILAVIEKRGRHLKGKPRTRKDTANPLGGRIFDMACGWLMYRYARRKRWCYGCGLYQSSQAKCCHHNVVSGETATLFVLGCLRQRLLTPRTMSKLTARLRELAAAEQGEDPARRQRELDQGELANVQRRLATAGRNMALAETPDQRAAMANVFDELKGDEARLQRRIADAPTATATAKPEEEVAAALAVLDRLGELVSAPARAWDAVGEAFRLVDVKLYLRFKQVTKGRQTTAVPAGGIVTFGSVPPPVPLYDGPTDRAHVARLLADGKPVTATPEKCSLGDSNDGQNVTGSANVQRGTRRCT